MTAILTPSVNSTFSQHLCPWTLVGEESTNSFGAPSLEQVLSSWGSLGCKQEVSVLLTRLCLGQRNGIVNLGGLSDQNKPGFSFQNWHLAGMSE